MMITEPPAKLNDNLVMLGSGEYPLYLFKGDTQAAIFEAGTGHVGPLLKGQLEQLDIDPAAVRQIVIPHAHPDHVMALPLMRKLFPGATLTASQLAAKTLSAEKAIALFCRLDDAISDSLSKAGLIPPGQRREELDEMRIPVDRIIAAGDKIEVDATAFDVLATPGHSDCSLAFHQSERGILIASDAVPYFMPQRDSWWPCYFGSYSQYIESIRHLQTLDVEMLCMGHRAVVTGKDDVGAFFKQIIEATENYHKRIIDETRAGRQPQAIAETLGSEIHEKTDLLPLEFFQKNCMLLVKQSLEHEGMNGD